MNGNKYEMVVGLEVHVQLRTSTKAFCACSTSFGDAPNANTCPVCLALPGALPVLNEHAVELAVKAARAIRCEVQNVSVFARKNYFYPDLPKGYQISQFDMPLALGGHIDIDTSAGPRRIGVTRLHMEEDAGKSIHDRYRAFTAIDLNRSGMPLVEIVSEPDMRTPEEAAAYLRALKEILLYADISDVNMEEGSLRVDANISIREWGSTELNTKTEVKNMNSFSGVEKALAAEYDRQSALVASGGQVQQQTMLWDAARGEVRPARSKEGSHDYRYFPEPDLPPLVLTHDYISHVASSLPELPEARRQRLITTHGLERVDAEILTATPQLAAYYEAVAAAAGDGIAAANWVKGEVLAELNASGTGLDALRVTAEALGALIGMVSAGDVSRTAGRKIFSAMVKEGGTPVDIAARDGLRQVGDQNSVSVWIDEVFTENPDEAGRFRGGERKLQGVLVGLVMKKSRGSADPRVVNQMLSERIGG